MSRHGFGMAHLYWRQHPKKLPPHPHPVRWKRWIDNTVLVAGSIGLLMTVPQIWTIYTSASASGVSAATWAAYLVISIAWLLYGLAHKVWPIVITNAFWIVFDIIIVVGVLIHS